MDPETVRRVDRILKVVLPLMVWAVLMMVVYCSISWPVHVSVENSYIVENGLDFLYSYQNLPIVHRHAINALSVVACFWVSLSLWWVYVVVSVVYWYVAVWFIRRYW